ncbi:LysM peptidoglycan-binding domain-containing protein [Marinilongibacter aquaticus]|uniref:LysM peptidoglycan-binding domain-containing protein n=1 Tax=Marinilongibacter aquaticus TaxID=2975157 RepID=UPI0021BDB23B|nr:LysM peptidoglycan-binding domain-containing protein [Marinilongibacter aquaticus]UBM60146.1 LysM peptidoglycan-binding domain-containing protein [Marinilongibacter aquaticus]
MKRLIAFLLFVLTTSLYAQSEIPLPKAPSKIEFANVVVNVDRHVQAQLDELIRGLLMPENAFLQAKLERMQWYFPIIEQILREEKVPDDLKYLAVMESNLYPDALSSSGAVGFWQFKTPTALEMGLRIDNDIDERKYIYSSTKAAAGYFKKNNEQFNNWVMCIYAFNQGAGGAAKELPKAWQSSSFVEFNRQTPEYLIKALANRIAFEYKLNRTKPSESTFIVYPTQNQSLNDIANKLNVDPIELKNYNVWAGKRFIPDGKTYNVLVPTKAENAGKSLALIREVEANAPTQKGVYPILKRLTKVATSDEDPIFYKINNKQGILARPGNEAAQLAMKGKVKLGSFLFFNDMSDRDLIKTGKVYYLEKKDKRGPVQFHTAAKGQTLWDISQLYGIRLKKLLKYNRIKNAEPIQAGQVVWLQSKRPRNQKIEIRPVPNTEETEENKPIPVLAEYNTSDDTEKASNATSNTHRVIDPTAQALDEPKTIVITQEPEEQLAEPVAKEEEKPDPNTPEYHVVQKGETLFAISEKYNISVTKLREINGLKPSSVLQYGEILKLKGEPVTYVRPAQNESEEMEEKEPVRISEPKANPKPNVEYHTVRSGQTLYSISKMYGCSVEDIQNWNQIRGTNIEVGQRLRVSQVSGNNAYSPSRTHVVRKGDTLFNIAQRNNVSVQDLRQWNNLRGNNIYIGQKLKIK